MEKNSVLVIGAGAAGLTAADELSQAGLPVILIEARERIGGRIHTIPSQNGLPPVELGAEFLHGARNATWENVRAAKLAVQEVPDRHWRQSDGELREGAQLWDELGQIFSGIDTSKPDMDFRSYLGGQHGASASARAMATQYVEGFHAAPVARMSILALAQAEAAAESDEATRQFRLARGYSPMLDWLVARLEARGVFLHCSTVVKTLRWSPGRVEAETHAPQGHTRFAAARAVVTLPLGVLQADGPGAVTFEPALTRKREAIAGLGMGSVVKVILQFRSRFWPVENFGFIHSDDPALPTWWADARGPVLTGWAGGPKAERLNLEPQEAILYEAVRALAAIFKIDQAKVRDGLIASYSHNWAADPFTRGGYSYTPAGMMAMPKLLAEPLADTLFFAGEATDSQGEQGTVQAAITSGKRAAHEILSSQNLAR